MSNKEQISVHPQLLRAVQQAVKEELKSVSLLDLQACQQALDACRTALIDMEQKFTVWHQLAVMYREKTDELKAHINEQNERMTAYDARMVELMAKLDEHHDH